MATGTPTPNTQNLSDEELERLTAPDQPSPETPVITIDQINQSTQDASVERIQKEFVGTVGASPEAEKPEVAQESSSDLTAADLDAHAAEQTAAAATGAPAPEVINTTQPVHPV